MSPQIYNHTNTPTRSLNVQIIMLVSRPLIR